MIRTLFSRRVKTPAPITSVARVFHDFDQATAFYVMLAVILPNEKMMDQKDGDYFPHLHHAIDGLQGGDRFLDDMADIKYKLNGALEHDLQEFNDIVLKNGMAFSSLKFMMELPAHVFLGPQNRFTTMFEKEKDNTRFKEWHKEDKLKSFIETLSRIEEASGQKFTLKSRGLIPQPLILKTV